MLFELLFKYSRADYARSELIYVGSWPDWLLVLLGGVAAAGIGFMLARRYRDVSNFRLAGIGILQLAMVAVVIWMLEQPTLTTERLREGENSVALVLDTSASMAYGDGQSRIQDALVALGGVLEMDDAPDLDVRYYELGDSARSVSSFVDSAPTSPATSIARSLQAILEEARFNPLAAVILSSDGADTAGGLSADDLNDIAAFGVPVHTIAVGRDTMPEDIELTDVTVPAKALPGTTISARVSIRHDAAGSTNVKVYNGDDLLQIVPIELRADAGSTSAWVELPLDAAGPRRLSFSLDPLPGEQELANNRRATLVDVANQDYRVLYFEGEPRWEYKFMRRALHDDESIEIASLLRVSPNKFYRQGITSPAELGEGFPLSRAELFAYDALIIGSVEAASLNDAQQKLIRDFVSERGGSLLMLAGPNGLGNGGWGQSLIADVLPVRLPPSSTDSFFRKRATARLTPHGASSPMLRFAEVADDNRAAWAELPEIADYQVTGALKPAAVTWLNADTDIGTVPLFMSQPFGRGHAYVLATGGTWRWQMSLPVEDLKHEVFWRQVLRALVANAPDNISLAASVSSAGSDIELRAEFRDDAFEAVGDINVSVIVSHESGESWTAPLLPSANEAGVYLARVTPSQSGTWYFEAVAERGGEPFAVSRTSLLHESGQAEHFGIRQNAALLRRIAEATGGQAFTADNLDGLPDHLRYSSSGITETEYRAIWDAPIVFLLLLMLKAGEWLLRRRWRTI